MTVTDERFAKMQPLSGNVDRLSRPRTCRPARAGRAAAEHRAGPLPSPVRAGHAQEVRRRVHRADHAQGLGRWCCSPGPSTPRRSSPATPRSSTPARATRSSARSWASTRCCFRTPREHKRARKLLMPAFNGAALRGYQSVVAPARRRGGRPLDAGRRVPLARPDERADPRGDPAGRVRSHRRDPAGPAAAAGQQDRGHLARGAARLGLPVPAAVRPLEGDRRQPARASTR